MKASAYRGFPGWRRTKQIIKKKKGVVIVKDPPIEDLEGGGFRVAYEIDDLEGEVTSWNPHWIENLQPGEHEIELTLLGADGEPHAIDIGPARQARARGRKRRKRDGFVPTYSPTFLPRDVWGKVFSFLIFE